MPHHGNSFISFGVTKRDMGDIEYLAIKEFGGKVRSDEGTLSATGDLATLTATTGKDMYLAKAKVSVYQNSNTNPTSVDASVTVQLLLNAIVKETYQVLLPWDSNPVFSPGNANYEFAISGLKVAAGQIIKLDVTAIGIDVDIDGVIQVFEEDTGADPTV